MCECFHFNETNYDFRIYRNSHLCHGEVAWFTLNFQKFWSNHNLDLRYCWQLLPMYYFYLWIFFFLNRMIFPLPRGKIVDWGTRFLRPTFDFVFIFKFQTFYLFRRRWRSLRLLCWPPRMETRLRVLCQLVCSSHCAGVELSQLNLSMRRMPPPTSRR